MNNNEKKWIFYVTLSDNMWGKKEDTMEFEEEAWDLVLPAAAKHGFNTIMLDVCDGVRYNSHPEIAIASSKSRYWVKEQIKKAADLGLKIMPNVNFSTTHDQWLGEYRRMVSTKPYYNVCRDVILEVCEIFDGPEILSLTMEEEDEFHVKKNGISVIRQGDIFWHDLQFLFDCSNEAGAIPYIASDSLFEHPEEFPKHMGVDNMIIGPWCYSAVREDHYTRIADRQIFIDYYNQPRYKWMNLTYVEEEPFFVLFREQALPNAKKGYKYIPGVSIYNESPWCEQDVLEYFSVNAPESILGFYEAPWANMTMKNLDRQYLGMERFKKARDMFFPEG